MPKSKSKSPYDVHPSLSMIQKWEAELPEKTGRSLEQWAEFARDYGPADRKACMAWLKDNHGLGTNAAYWIVDYSRDKATWDANPDVYLKQAAEYVDAMFLKGKEWQRPIFEAIMAAVKKLGADVKVCPCKTMIPFYRRREFAHVKPATKSRLELVLALPDVPHGGRLKPNPRANEKDRHHHIIELTDIKEVDATVLKWLKVAYEADGEDKPKKSKK